ncbi:hypothetical protein FQA47_009975 [Oryzias melastigma]|uniref:Uncharacterized protein n=1 Tax=Oryzias melastigma TaxID=30732 RepID=A0A834FBP6_ORYME|nr:hypothetical protein FQA47_009975 [Oryzias melastigma]
MKKDGTNRRSSHCDASPELENRRPVSATVLHHDHLTAGFRRRCHTLDSQMNTYQTAAGHVDRSQERVPRFMAGVVRLPPTRHTSTAPSNQSFEVDSSFSSLSRPHTTPDAVTFRLKHDEPNSAMKASTLFRTGNTVIPTEDSQWRAQALESMQKRLEEEHGLKMSLLLAEQEKEQQCPHLVGSCNHKELEERRSMEQGFVGENPCGWNCRSVNSSCPAISPSCPGLSPVRTPSELSPGHTLASCLSVEFHSGNQQIQSKVELGFDSRAAESVLPNLRHRSRLPRAQAAKDRKSKESTPNHRGHAGVYPLISD